MGSRLGAKCQLKSIGRGRHARILVPPPVASQAEISVRARPGGIPLTENDLDDLRVLTPQLVVKGVDIPRKAVACFCARVIDSIAGQGRARVWSGWRSEPGEHPVHEIEHTEECVRL